MTNILGKLQCEVDSLRKVILELKDKNQALIDQNKDLKYRIKKQNEDLENKISDAIKKALEKYENDEIIKLTDENIKLKKRIFELEKRLNISSETSNLPPSKDALWHKTTKVYDERSVKKTTNKVGGQKNHPKNILKPFNDDEITDHEYHEPLECDKCHSKNIELVDEDCHDVLDFEINIKKIRHHFKKGKCNECGAICKCEVPQNLWGENQYGANVQALGMALVEIGDVSYKRSRDLIKGLTNGEINPCEGYLTKLPKKASKLLSNFIFDLEEEIVNSKIIQHDDGVIKIGKDTDTLSKQLEELIEKKKDNELSEEEKNKLYAEINKNFNGVLRAYTNGTVRLYKAHTSKDFSTYEDDNILTRLKKDQVVVHDHLKLNYNENFYFENAECNIHPIRKGRGIKANTNHEWPDKISELLETYNEKKKLLVSQKITQFTPEELDRLNTSYDKIVDDGIIEAKSFIHKTEYADEMNLLNFFKKYKKEILLWANNFSIPFTNNLCETMIRLVKSKMKISYCFKNINTAQDYANIISYIETCYVYGVNRYSALKRLFENSPYTLAELKNLSSSVDNLDV